MISNVLPLHFVFSSSQNSNVENFMLDLYNPFKILSKILRTLPISCKDYKNMQEIEISKFLFYVLAKWNSQSSSYFQFWSSLIKPSWNFNFLYIFKILGSNEYGKCFQLLESVNFPPIPWNHKPTVNARQFTTDDFMMSETLGLVKTLGWKVVDGIILTIQVYNSYNFY